MKSKLIYLFLLPLVVIAGCSKTPQTTVVNPPLGIFSGQFVGLHRSTVYANYDTIKANLQLTLSTTTGFSVLGDTTQHAGSYGSFSVTSTTITFYDQTYYPSTVPYKKVHLSGTYPYSWDGTNLEIAASIDTLIVDYKFKKTGNN